MTRLRMIWAAIFAVAFTLVAAPTIALASAPPPVNADTTDVSTFTVAAPIVTLLVSFVIPLINGIITRPSTAPGVKAIITIVLNAASAILVNGLLADGSSAFSTETLYTAVIGCLISGFSYANLFKPMNITSNAGGKLAAVGVKD